MTIRLPHEYNSRSVRSIGMPSTVPLCLVRLPSMLQLKSDLTILPDINLGSRTPFEHARPMVTTAWDVYHSDVDPCYVLEGQWCWACPK